MNGAGTMSGTNGLGICTRRGRRRGDRQRQRSLFGQIEVVAGADEGAAHIGCDARQQFDELAHVERHAGRHVRGDAAIERHVDTSGAAHLRRNALHWTTTGYAAEAAATNNPRQPSLQPP